MKETLAWDQAPAGVPGIGRGTGKVAGGAQGGVGRGAGGVAGGPQGGVGRGAGRFAGVEEGGPAPGAGRGWLAQRCGGHGGTSEIKIEALAYDAGDRSMFDKFIECVAIAKAQGNISVAIECLHKYLAIFMADNDAWRELAEICVSLQMYKQAAFCYEELILCQAAVPLYHLANVDAAGNKAFQAGKHLEAVEHYTTALACNVESRPFAAICFCNRAAAYLSLGQIPDAIADCCLAIALDTHNAKAISCRATFDEMIPGLIHASADLQRLLACLQEKAKENSVRHQQALSSVNDALKQARACLSLIETESTPLNFYMILGIDQSSSRADIKKAYRKTALRLHPDKFVGNITSPNPSSLGNSCWLRRKSKLKLLKHSLHSHPGKI